MTEKATYENDFEGVYLMHATFPSGNYPKAVSALERNDKVIQKAARKLFASNHLLFNRIGMDRDDLTSILRSYAYRYFTKYADDMKFFNRFMKQRIGRFIETCQRKAEGIGEENFSLDTEALVEAASTHNDNPETLLLAKERLNEILSIIGSTLSAQAGDYVTKLHLTGKLGKIPKSYAIDIASSAAFDYAAKAVRNDEQIDAEKFKLYLTSKFSKVLGKIR